MKILFRLKKELNCTDINKYIRNCFRLGKETKAIKDKEILKIKNTWRY